MFPLMVLNFKIEKALIFNLCSQSAGFVDNSNSGHLIQNMIPCLLLPQSFRDLDLSFAVSGTGLKSNLSY